MQVTTVRLAEAAAAAATTIIIMVLIFAILAILVVLRKCPLACTKVILQIEWIFYSNSVVLAEKTVLLASEKKK